jgi:hypothetical protein
VEEGMRISVSTSLREEVQKNPELKALSKKPMSQLTDDELWKIYKIDYIRYLPDRLVECEHLVHIETMPPICADCGKVLEA